MFSLDNLLVSKTTFIVKLFKYVHPNCITLVGGILNFVLIYDLYFSDKIIFPTFIFILRVLIDIYDGAVARYFKKTSKIGGLLDTISDLILSFFIIIYLFNLIFKLSFLLSLFLSSISLLKIIHTMKINNSLTNHSNLKVTTKTNLTSRLGKMWSNNIILFIFIVPIFFYYQKCY